MSSTFLYGKLVQIFDSLRGILVKWVNIKTAHQKLLFWCKISSAKAKDSFTVNLLNVIEESLGTENFASL